MKKTDKKGFTLIELLVVIAIIGILSSIVLVSLNSAREKARDAKRKGDMQGINTAITLYSDAGNSAAPPADAVSCAQAGWNTTAGNCFDLTSTFDATYYPNGLPAGTTGYEYVYTNETATSGNTTYCVAADLESVAGDAFICDGSGCHQETAVAATYCDAANGANER